jgi:hypothetical protein
MQTLDQNLQDLVKRNRVIAEPGRAANKDNFAAQNKDAFPGRTADD